MNRIVLHIDRLVLNGFRDEDRHGIAEGLQHELTRLFADPQAARQLTANGNMSRLPVGSIKINHDTKPQHVGSQLAQGIGKGMRK